MLASLNSTTNNTAVNSELIKNSAKPSQTDAAASQDRFLKLLVAQLNNQDPMNPMDNAQMTSQMAQINTVSGIQQLNETINSLSSQFNSMQEIQASTMIGREVLTKGNTLTVNAGIGKGAIDLEGNADKVTVQVLSPGGQVLDTLNLGAMSQGRNNFEWDATKYTGSAMPLFKVTATQGKQPILATPLNRDTIASIGSDGTSMSVFLKAGSAVKYEDIKAIL